MERKPSPCSFSMIKAFEQCPKKFYHVKVVRDFKEPKTAALDYGNEFHKAAELYVRDGVDLPQRFDFARGAIDSLLDKEGEKLCELEMAVTENLKPCGFKDDAAWFRGIADLVILNRTEKLAWVIDYKTSKSARYADKGQLELMALMLFKHFPEIETVRAGLLFVVCNALVKSKYERSEEGKLWRRWMSDYTRMEKSFERDVWNAHPSGLCKAHCVVTSCPHNGRN